jgi:hypothetical protein
MEEVVKDGLVAQPWPWPFPSSMDEQSDTHSKKTLAEIEDMSEREKALDEIVVLLLVFVQYKLYLWRARGASGGGNDGGTNLAVIASVSGMC